MADGWQRLGDDAYFNGWYVFTFPKEMPASVRESLERALCIHTLDRPAMDRRQ